MARRWIGTLLVAAAVAGAPMAGADPEIHVPHCSGDQTPMNSNCQYPPMQGYEEGSPGANPDVPLGLNPGSVPAV